MTIKQVMSQVTTKTPQSFRGLVDVDGTPLPVALSFVAAAVVLTVADEEIGRWSLGEIEFKATSDRRFEIHAEGDFLPFTPSDHDSFQSFITAPGPVNVEEMVDEDAGGAELSLGGPLLDPGADSNGSPLLAEHEATEPDFGLSEDSDPLDPDELSDALGSSFQLPLAPGSRVNGSIEPATDEEGEDLLGKSDPPDEYFAAGWHGPDGAAIPQTPTFRLAPVPSPAESVPDPTPAPDSSLGRRMGDFLLGGEPAAPAPQIHPPSSANQPAPAEPAVSTGEPTVSPVTPPVAAEPADTSELPATPEEPTVPDTEDSQNWEPSPRNRLGGFVDRIEPSNPGPAAELTPPEPEAPPTVPAKSGGRLASAAEAIRNRVSDGGREQIDPSEKNRQWRLLAVGGAGFVVLLAGIIWGLAALLGGGDAAVAAGSPTDSGSPVTADETNVPDPAPVTTAAPTTSTSTSLTTTTVAPNPVAVTGGDPGQFVSDWNAIAAGYSASLTVAGSEFPVEANLSQSIRLTYANDGVLTIAATPNGSASDQDILVTMGVIVAWAEPSLAPEQRKDVLATVGIDVTNPQLANMTGSSIRGGLEYRARVEGSTLYFSVGPVG